MRRSILLLGLALAACTTAVVPVTSRTLAAADAATALAVGERIVEERSSQTGAAGQDPIVTLALRHSDGRRLAFQQANHSPHDIMAQSAGGPLAQIMGLGEEAPRLYRSAGGGEGAFFCGPQGPAAIGVHEAADGTMLVVGLRQEIQFETRPDGQTEAVPYSPDQVCARLRFRQG